MRKNLLILSFLLLGLMSNSQTLELYTQNNILLNNGDTISVDSLSTTSDSLSFNEMIVFVKVKNISNSPKTVNCEKQPQSVIPGTENTFCWGLCFPPTTYVSPDPLIIDSSEVSSGFSGHYSPKNITGTSLIRYVFRVLHGDTAWIYIKYNADYNSVANISYNSNISEPYPNPSNNIVNVNFNVPYKNNINLLLYNAYGKLAKQINLENTNKTINFNVSDLASGIYFYSLNIDGKIVKTNKLIVDH